MNFISKSSLVLFIGVLTFVSCKKEQPVQPVNNYYTSPSNDNSSVNMKLLKEFGATDSSSKLTFTYYNGERSKLKEMRVYGSGVPAAKIIINYDVSGNPESYQAFSLPSNTLDVQGTYVVDQNNNINKIILRDNLGDTTNVFTFSYILVGGKYKIASKAFFSPSDNKNIYYDYYEYNEKGFITKTLGYNHVGASLYKSSVTECIPSSIINSFPNILNYTLLGADNMKEQASLYFSSYIPNSAVINNYNATGDLTSTDIKNYQNILFDADNNVTFIDLTASSTVYFKY